MVTSTLAFEGDGKWREYEGDVQDWLTQSARAVTLSQRASPAAVQGTEASEKNASLRNSEANSLLPKRKLGYKEQRELDSLPARIAALEAEQAQIDEALADGKLYTTDPTRASQLSERHARIDDEMLAAMERLEVLGGPV